MLIIPNIAPNLEPQIMCYYHIDWSYPQLVGTILSWISEVLLQCYLGFKIWHWIRDNSSSLNFSICMHHFYYCVVEIWLNYFSFPSYDCTDSSYSGWYCSRMGICSINSAANKSLWITRGSSYYFTKSETLWWEIFGLQRGRRFQGRCRLQNHCHSWLW